MREHIIVYEERHLFLSNVFETHFNFLKIVSYKYIIEQVISYNKNIRDSDKDIIN